MTGAWPAHPIIYEINAWVWLDALSRELGRRVMLGDVPRGVWDELAALGLDAVWLMGVWERSPAGREVALRHPAVREQMQAALPDFRPEDVAGSPYAVRRYVVEARLGGRDGLAAARAALAARGIKLLLDFVPNHVALDHPWAVDHPSFFIQGRDADLAEDPQAFTRVADAVLAHGRDPYFPAWTDTLQMNAFSPGMRRGTIATLRDVAAQCDGVRCDMAMLLLNAVFARTWGARAGVAPGIDFWRAVIPAVRTAFADFRFLAEVYWDLEGELLAQGFDWCYDKRLYDWLAHGDATAVRAHLTADVDFQQRLARFIENHDEPRAAATFAPGRLEAALVVVATLPGALLLHEGQLDGRRVRVPVQLGRRPDEPRDDTLHAFSTRLLRAVRETGIGTGDWTPCPVRDEPADTHHRQLLVWAWTNGARRTLVVVNDGAAPARGQVQLPWPDLAGTTWRLTDRLDDSVQTHDGEELARAGLPVALAGWGRQVLSVTAAPRIPGDA